MGDEARHVVHPGVAHEAVELYGDGLEERSIELPEEKGHERTGGVDALAGVVVSVHVG